MFSNAFVNCLHRSSFSDRNLIRSVQLGRLIIDDRTKYNRYLKIKLSAARRSFMPLPKAFRFNDVNRVNFRWKTLLEQGKEMYVKYK